MGTQTASQALGTQEQYEDLYLGLVISNEDPEGLDRVKAVVPNLYDDAETAPWIGPSTKYSPFWCGPGFGTFGSPVKGSLIIIELQGGNPQFPVYSGSFLHKQVKDANMMKLFHNLAWGFIDPSGNILVVDMKTQQLTFKHSTNVILTIEGGNLKLQVPGNVQAEIGGNLNATVGGATRIESGGDCSIQAAMIHLNGG